MNQAMILFGLFFVTMASNDNPPFMELMQKSFDACKKLLKVDEAILRAVSVHGGEGNEQVECFRGCMLHHSELLSEDNKFNFKKFGTLLRAERNADPEKAEVFTSFAKICVKLAQGLDDKCKIAGKYMKCYNTVVRNFDCLYSGTSLN